MLRRKFYININNDYSMIAGGIALADCNPPPPPMGKCPFGLCASHLFQDGAIPFAYRSSPSPPREKHFLVWDKDVIPFADHNSLPMPIPRQWRRVEPFYQYDLLLYENVPKQITVTDTVPREWHRGDQRYQSTLLLFGFCGTGAGDTPTAAGDIPGVEVFSTENLGPHPFFAKISRVTRDLFTHFQRPVLSLFYISVKVYNLQRRISVLTKHMSNKSINKRIEKETYKKLAIDLATFTTEIQNTTEIHNCVEINQNRLLAEYPDMKQEVTKQIKTIRLLEEWRRHRSVAVSTKPWESSEISAPC